MGPTVVNGLPAHVLLVHIVVVLVPLTALALVVCAVWPRARRRAGIALPILALVTLVSVPLTAHAGEWLEHHVDSDPLVRRHADMGDHLLPWAIGLFLLATAVWWTGRRGRAAGTPAAGSTGHLASAARNPVWVAAALLALAVGVGSTLEVYRIGDSGAQAAWHDGFSKKPVAQHHGDRGGDSDD